jgi:GNAT superfamily N-acetyltransferase
MPLSNYDRLIKLAEETYAMNDDPSQLNVNKEVRDRLIRIHPATLSEYSNENGPVAWLLVIPTTIELMNRFLKKEISEKELFELTPLNTTYEALYLCSGLVLEEYRRKGIIRALVVKAIEEIRKDHPVKVLFSWAFTREGGLAAEALAKLTGLPLLKRN